MFSLFNFVHIIFILSSFLSVFLLYIFLKNKSKKFQLFTFLILMSISFIFEFSNIFTYVEYGWETLFYNLPLFGCDLNNIILPFIFVKVLMNKPVNNLFHRYVIYFVPIGALITIIFPSISSNQYYFYDSVVYEIFISHIIYFCVSIVYFKLLCKNINVNNTFNLCKNLVIWIFCINFINVLLRESEIFEYSNYMFTVEGFYGEILYFVNSNLIYIIGPIYLSIIYILWTVFCTNIFKKIPNNLFVSSI